MKQKAMLIKDFYNDKGALHRGEKVVIEGQAAEGFTRVITGTGAVYVIPSHIIKKIPWQFDYFLVTYWYEESNKLYKRR